MSIQTISRSNGWGRLVLSIAAAPLLLSVSAQTFAAEHYVRSDATGSGNGSDWTNAYTALPSSLVRGDTYYIADGSYSGYRFDDANSGSTIITIKKAIPSDHGTSTGWTDSYGDGQAAFTGGLLFTTSNWVIDGQTGGGAENNWVGNFGISITERGDAVALLSLGTIAMGGVANNIQIRHVDLQGKGSVSTQGGGTSNDALAVYGSINVTLSYFRMRGIGRCPVFASPRNLVVEHGWVESYNGNAAVHSEVASLWSFSGSVGDVTFRYNLVTDLQSTGGIMWDNVENPSAQLYVYGNVFYKPPGRVWDEANGVVGGWTGNAGEEFHNARVYNNSFVNIDQETLSSFPRIFSGNVAYNNIFYNSQSPNFSKFQGHDSNVFINSGSAQSELNGTTGTTNPFVDIAALNFRLRAATLPGTPVQAPLNIDPLGVTRGIDGVADRGAFEYDSGAITATPSPPTSLAVF